MGGRRVCGAVLVVAVSLAVSSCTPGDAPVSSTDAPASSSSPSASATDPTTGDEVQLLESRHDLIGSYPIHWEEWEALDEHTLRIYFMSGLKECYGVSVETTEGPDKVRIQLNGGSVPGDEPCRDIGVASAVDVVLSWPLGDRKVITP